MENLFVVQNIPNVTGVGAITNFDGLSTNDLVVLGDGRVFLSYDSAPADLADIDFIQFVTKLSDNKFKISVPIPRRNIINYNLQETVNSRPGSQILGGTTASTGLDIPTEGEALLTVVNNSYNHAIATTKFHVNLVKKASETPVVFLARFRDAVNVAASQNGSFVTCSLLSTVVGLDTFYGLRFNCATTDVDLSLSTDGILLGCNKYVDTKVIQGVGIGADVAKMEREMSRHLGYQGYVNLPDLWYKQPLETDVNENYDMATISWIGQAMSATSSKHVANNTLSFALENGTVDLDNAKALFNLVLGYSQTVTAGITDASDADTDATDNTVS